MKFQLAKLWLTSHRSPVGDISSAQDDIDAREQQLHLGGGQFADAFREKRFIQRNDLRNVRYGILWKTS